MSRGDFAALHRAFETVRQWPSPIREQVVRFYAGGASRPDRPSSTAVIATASQPAEQWPEVWKPRSKQRRPPKPKPPRLICAPDKARILELELLEAMRSHPGASTKRTGENRRHSQIANTLAIAQPGGQGRNRERRRRAMETQGRDGRLER